MTEEYLETALDNLDFLLAQHEAFNGRVLALSETIDNVDRIEQLLDKQIQRASQNQKFLQKQLQSAQENASQQKEIANVLNNCVLPSDVSTRLQSYTELYADQSDQQRQQQSDIQILSKVVLNESRYRLEAEHQQLT